jgi:hypothetical protein
MCILCDMGINLAITPVSIIGPVAEDATGVNVPAGESQEVSAKPVDENVSASPIGDAEVAVAPVDIPKGLQQLMDLFKSAMPTRDDVIKNSLGGLNIPYKSRLGEEISLADQKRFSNYYTSGEGLTHSYVPAIFQEAGRTYATLAAAYILADLVPEWEQLFEAKNAEYGEYDSELGELGETVEVWRKAKKLRRAFIDKVDTSNWSETPRTVALDMIGHLFLLIMLMDEAGAGDQPQA